MTVGTAKGSKAPGLDDSIGTQIRPTMSGDTKQVYLFQDEHKMGTLEDGLDASKPRYQVEDTYIQGRYLASRQPEV